MNLSLFDSEPQPDTKQLRDTAPESGEVCCAVEPIACKSIINKSRIPGVDYTVNPYLGCQHGCLYCYATFMNRFVKRDTPWGRYVGVKTNARQVLLRQIKRLRPGTVSLSTVTDPYQQQEKVHRLSRQVLEVLAQLHFSVSVLTKSPLVLRDIDILQRFPKQSVSVGFSLMSLDDQLRGRFEPQAPAVQSRLKALGQLRHHGIQTWVFLAPLLPFEPRQQVSQTVATLAPLVDYILVDRLNLKHRDGNKIPAVLRSCYPEQTRGLNSDGLRKRMCSLYSEQKQLLKSQANQHGVELRFCR